MALHTERSPRWRRRPAERPEEILSAALEVFADDGLAGARVSDIAARAGISKGTLYLYFNSKEELFREAIRTRVANLLASLSSAAPPGEPKERLARFIDALWSDLQCPRFAKLHRLIQAELHHFPELARFYATEISGKVTSLIAEIVAEGVEAGVFRDVEPYVAARMVMGLLVQHAVWAHRREIYSHLRGRNEEVLVEEVRDFVFHALAASGTSGRGRAR
jgi:AcrR family transcriptional regulator